MHSYAPASSDSCWVTGSLEDCSCSSSLGLQERESASGTNYPFHTEYMHT